MLPIDPEMIGSMTDVVTLAVVLRFLARLRDRVDGVAAGVVALARPGRVREDQLQRELDVEDRDVEAVLED